MWSRSRYAKLGWDWLGDLQMVCFERGQIVTLAGLRCDSWSLIRDCHMTNGCMVLHTCVCADQYTVCRCFHPCGGGGWCGAIHLPPLLCCCMQFGRIFCMMEFLLCYLLLVWTWTVVLTMVFILQLFMLKNTFSV